MSSDDAQVKVKCYPSPFQIGPALTLMTCEVMLSTLPVPQCLQQHCEQQLQ